MRGMTDATGARRLLLVASGGFLLSRSIRHRLISLFKVHSSGRGLLGLLFSRALGFFLSALLSELFSQSLLALVLKGLLEWLHQLLDLLELASIDIESGVSTALIIIQPVLKSWLARAQNLDRHGDLARKGE